MKKLVWDYFADQSLRYFLFQHSCDCKARNPLDSPLFKNPKALLAFLIGLLSLKSSFTNTIDLNRSSSGACPMKFSWFPSQSIQGRNPLSKSTPLLDQTQPSPFDLSQTSPPTEGLTDHLIELAWNSIPESVLNARVRLIGICQDALLLWHLYRLRVHDLDAVICHPNYESLFRLAGVSQVITSFLAGPKNRIEPVDPAQKRSIDILVIGNLNPAIHTDRTRFLLPLTRLRPRWNVRIVSGLPDEASQSLLADTRIVIRISEPAAADSLLSDSTANGALVLQNAEGYSLPDDLQGRFAAIPFTVETLPTLLETYLNDEESRQEFVRRCQQDIFTYWEGAERALTDLQAILPRIRSRRDLDSPAAKRDRLLARVWQSTASAPYTDPTIVRDLERMQAQEPSSAVWANALGVSLSRPELDGAGAKSAARVALRHFQRAIELDPQHYLARFNLVQTHQVLGNTEQAKVEIVRLLSMLPSQIEEPASWLEEPHVRFEFSWFRVEWEKAAWTNVVDQIGETRSKFQLLRWSLQATLAQLTSRLAHAYESYLARPDLPAAHALLGQFLAKEDQPLEALHYLSVAVESNLFDSETARILFETLYRIGERQALSIFARDRLNLRWSAPGNLPNETWAIQAPPPPDELVSIVILCSNVVEVTKLCLESLVQTTKSPYEVVIIDNGSIDSTPEVLADFQNVEGPQRVVVVRNEENIGFPKGCNQALARTRGRFILFLNNDVILTTGWLERLKEQMLLDWPNTAAIGPVTNYAPAPQLIKPEYERLEDLDAFAQNWYKAHTRRTLEASRITGFCLLTRREVLDQVGAFDGRYELGFFDDDDLCLRIREAGWKLRVAVDVYIHHWGSQTFKALNIDTRKQLFDNFARFKEKWGEDKAQGYKLVSIRNGEQTEGGDIDSPSREESPNNGVPETPPHIITRPKITLSMIVKNEEKHLPDCLRTTADLFDEVVIADTGSTDNTVKIAESYGARIVDFPWIKSFGAARNASLQGVRTPWVMWLDADDRLDEQNRANLKKVLSELGDEVDARAIQVRSFMDPARSVSRLLDQVRIFPNRPGVEWDYRIHEQILPSVRRLGGNVRWTNVIVDHVGYQDSSARQGKLERNLDLLELDYQERSSDAFTLFNLGWTKMDLGRTQEAFDHLKESLERSTPDSSITRKLYDLLCHCCRVLNRREESQEWLDKGLATYPDDPELLLVKANYHREERNYQGASQALEKILFHRQPKYFSSLDDGVRGYRTRHQLAELYREQQRLSEAEVHWRAAVQEKPSFVPAVIGLGELLLSQQRWDEVDPVADILATQPNEYINSEVMRCRGLLSQNLFSEVRARTEELIHQYPQVIGPRVLLSHALLRAGNDWFAAEKCLQDILKLDPNHGEAKHNLEMLHKNQPEVLAPRPVVVKVEMLILVQDWQNPFLTPLMQHYLDLGVDRIHLGVLQTQGEIPKALTTESRIIRHRLDQESQGTAIERVQRLRDSLLGDVHFLVLVEPDEFLVPREGWNLKEALAPYINENILDATSYAVLPRPEDASLDFGKPLIGQRQWGVRQYEDKRPSILSRPTAQKQSRRPAPLIRLKFLTSDRSVFEAMSKPQMLDRWESEWQNWLSRTDLVRLPIPRKG